MPAAVGRDLAGPRLRAGGPREVGRIEALAAVAVDKAAQVTPRAQGKAARRRHSQKLENAAFLCYRCKRRHGRCGGCVRGRVVDGGVI